MSDVRRPGCGRVSLSASKFNCMCFTGPQSGALWGRTQQWSGCANSGHIARTFSGSLCPCEAAMVEYKLVLKGRDPFPPTWPSATQALPRLWPLDGWIGLARTGSHTGQWPNQHQDVWLILCDKRKRKKKKKDQFTEITKKVLTW